MASRTGPTGLALLLLPVLCCCCSGAGAGVGAGGEQRGSGAEELEVQQPVWERAGDLQLGVVLSLTAFDKDQMCGTVLRQPSALHRLHAIVFALEEINRNPRLLPGVRLGFVVMDDCSRDAAALLRALRFIRNPACPTGQDLEAASAVFAPLGGSQLVADGSRSSWVVNTAVKTYDVVGVLGAELSECSMQMAALLSAFRIPQLSYASSSPFLSDKNKFAFFTRIVPSDRQQAEVLVDMLQQFQWTYVAVVYSYGVYGLSVETRGFCLAAAIATESEYGDKNYDRLIDDLLGITPKVKVVVLFTLHARSILRAAKRKEVSGRFIWVSSDALVPNVKDFKGIKAISVGLLVVGFKSAPIKRFEDKFQYSTLRNSSENPWFLEFYKEMFQCTTDWINATLPLCNPDLPILHSPLYERNTSVMRAINAVYAFAYALHDVIKGCIYTKENVTHCFRPEDLLLSLRKTRFRGENDVLVGIDSMGDGIATYQIRNLQVDRGHYSFVTVGEWDGIQKNFTFLHKRRVMWHPEVLRRLKKEEGEQGEGENEEEGVAGEGRDRFPSSTCRERCGVGQQAVSTWPRCCWVCKDCRENEITVMRDDMPICDSCPSATNFTWPDPDTRTQCVPIPVLFVSMASPLGLALLTLDLCVLGLVVTCTVLYVRHRANRLIKATSRELSAVMLGGHFLACLAVGVFLLPPTAESCLVGHVFFHVSLTLVYAPLLVKINRIYRIFVAGKRSARAPRFIGSGFQLVASLAVVLVHLLLIVALMMHAPPTQQTRMPSPNDMYVERVCVVSERGFLASLIINLALMVACALHSLSTRKLPANYNEAKFITICIYTIAVLWLSFLATYFVLDTGVVHTLCLALTLLVNVISCQVFLFVPKLYAVLKLPSSTLKLQVASETTEAQTKVGNVCDAIIQ
ncbi:hypothetical protein ACOMHN_023677 [Nucella lapillus]